MLILIKTVKRWRNRHKTDLKVKEFTVSTVNDEFGVVGVSHLDDKHLQRKIHQSYSHTDLFANFLSSKGVCVLFVIFTNFKLHDSEITGNFVHMARTSILT